MKRFPEVMGGIFLIVSMTGCCYSPAYIDPMSGIPYGGNWEPASPPSNFWDDSGHPDGGPIDQMDGRGSLDVVLTDSVYHVNGSAVTWAHAEEDTWYHYEERITEMNVGYADGHVELHRHANNLTTGVGWSGSASWGPYRNCEGYWINHTGNQQYFVY